MKDCKVCNKTTRNQNKRCQQHQKSNKCRDCSKVFKTLDLRVLRCEQCLRNNITGSSYWVWFRNQAQRAGYVEAFQNTDHLELLALYKQLMMYRSYYGFIQEDEFGFSEDYDIGMMQPLEADHRFPLQPSGGCRVGEVSARNLMIVPTSLNRAKTNKVINGWGFSAPMKTKIPEKELDKWLLRNTNVNVLNGKIQTSKASRDKEFECKYYSVLEVIRSEVSRLKIVMPDYYLQNEDTAKQAYKLIMAGGDLPDVKMEEYSFEWYNSETNSVVMDRYQKGTLSTIFEMDKPTRQDDIKLLSFVIRKSKSGFLDVSDLSPEALTAVCDVILDTGFSPREFVFLDSDSDEAEQFSQDYNSLYYESVTTSAFKQVLGI